MRWIDTTHRSNAAEIMDDFDMEGEILRDALDKIAKINQLLGGNKVTIEGVKILRSYIYPALHHSYFWRIISFFSFMFNFIASCNF